MAINHPKAGPNSIPAYQMSGVPYVTSSAANEVPNSGASSEPIKLTFPYVTRFFQVECTDASEALRVGFSRNGVKAQETSNYFVVGTNKKSDVLELRTKELYFLSDNGTNPSSFRVVAGLTTIEGNEFPILTGSVGGTLGFEGVG